jgi:hypothetical protein
MAYSSFIVADACSVPSLPNRGSQEKVRALSIHLYFAYYHAQKHVFAYYHAQKHV